jgi:hypothetical protein
MLASISDIQNFLGDDKIIVTDANSNKAGIEADRLIRGQLAGVFTPLTLSTWVDPETTPELIRGISGRLCAAFIYRATYSEEQEAVPEYAQVLYNEALMMLSDIKEGTLTVIDPGFEPIDSSGSILSFWPDNTTSPAFTMDQTFA